MAISEHSDEWKRIIATAALAGVTFQRYIDPRAGEYYRPITIWRASVPLEGAFSGRRRLIEGKSKYDVAAKALRILGGLPLQVRKTEGKEQ